MVALGITYGGCFIKGHRDPHNNLTFGTIFKEQTMSTVGPDTGHCESISPKHMVTDSVISSFMLHRQQSPKLHEAFVPCACCMLAVTVLQAFNLGPRLEGALPEPHQSHRWEQGNGNFSHTEAPESFSQQQPGSLPLTVN